MIEINLLPGAVRKARRGGVSPMAVFSGLGDRFKDKYLIGGLATAAVGIAAIAGMYLMQTRKEHVLEERQIAASRDSARFAAVLEARRHTEARRDSVYQQLAVIKSIDDTRFTWPHLLEEVNLALPAYTWLTGVTQTSAITTTAGNDDSTAAGKKPGAAAAAKDTAAKKATATEQRADAKRKRMHADSLFKGQMAPIKFRITGQTVDLQALTLFMKNLEASPFIKNVQLTRSDLVMVDNKEVTEFQLEAESELPPPALIQTVPLSIAVH